MYMKPNIYVLNNQLLLIQSLMQWRKTPDKSIRVIYKQNYMQSYPGENKHSSKDLLNSAIESSIANLSMQSFAYVYEFLKNNMDDKMSTKLKNLRNKLSSNTSNLNTVKFLDTIRQSFAHNDITATTPNWRYTEDFKIEINLKNNHFVFSVDEFREVMNEFLNLKQDHFEKQYLVLQSKIFDCANKGTLKPENINKVITEIGDDGGKMPFDKYQCSALYNLICYTSNKSLINMRIDKLLDNNIFLLARLLPLKQSGGMMAFKNNMSIRMLYALQKAVLSRDVFVYVSAELESKYNLLDWIKINDADSRADMVEFMLVDTNLFEVTLLNNVLFNLFSLIPPNDISKHFSHSADFRRIRNSVMHGRYFFDHNHTFELYDGKDESNLTHIASLSIEQIIDFAASFLESYIKNNKTV